MRHLGLKTTGFLLFGSTSIAAILAGTPDASAQCVLTPTAGDDVTICASGISLGGLTDPGGSNTLLFPDGGTGTLNGNVVFGPGADRIEMNSGTITGAVDQGDGADSFEIDAGTVAGNVQQGSGIDEFRMNGGQIQSLNQGDNLDDFLMSGGRIVDFFDDGDIAVMTGGRIGRVNMKLDDNLFDMSGGTIDRNLVTGFGNDTIILSDGTIGGNISVSGGTDSVTVTGGSVGGSILLSFGTDSFIWDGGGIIYGAIDLGPDNDTAVLRNLTEANLGATPQITGGLGTDGLTFDNVATGGVARFQNFETIGLTNDTELTFDGTLVLGDSGTGTGALSVDAASTIFGGNSNGAISPFAAGQLASVTNAGRIDLSNGGGGTSDRFTITGNYLGDAGLLFLDTVLGDDSSASDRLVISQGTAGGATSIGILNAGGTGAATTQDGILVVEAAGGATTQSGAFALTGRVAAGAYEYFLFKGGVSANTGDNWYLRSSLETPAEGPPPEAAPTPSTPPEAEPQPEEPEAAETPPPPLAQPAPPLLIPPDDPTPPDDPAPPVEAGDAAPQEVPEPPAAEAADPPPPPPEPATGTAPLPGLTVPSPGATPVLGTSVPLFRVEVPTYSAAPPAAHQLALSSLGTFHERRGGQSLLQGAGALPASWGRIFGQGIERKWSGTVAPTFDGELLGFQAGQDLFGREFAEGHTTRLGVFGGYAEMDGDIRGQALGFNDLAVGDLDLAGTSFGSSITHIAPAGWYLDGVVMGTWFDGEADSVAGLGIDIDGSAVTASLEGGTPIALTPEWSLEPQGQIVWQHLSLDDRADRFSDVSFDTDDAVTGRLGLRLQGAFAAGGRTFEPYLKANVWHAFDADQTVRFGETAIVSDLGGTSLELGGGIVAGLNESVSLFATADYTTDIDGEEQEIVEGNIGISIRW